MTLEHELPLIGTVSMGLGIAFAAGFGASRVGLPPLVGYLLAGVVVGPFTPGFVADPGIAAELAEIGVILLMFGVGTHFSIRDLWSVRRIALPGAIVQILVATALGAIAARFWGWSVGASLVFGLALSTASTVVLLRALQERGLLDSIKGRIAVGWLVVEDLAMVLALILLPAFAGFLGGTPGQAPGVSETLTITIAFTFLKIAFFFAAMYVIGLRLFPWLSVQLTLSGSAELATLFVAAMTITLAYGAAVVFGVSFALGAFLAGVVVNEAGLTHRFSSQAQVLEHVFAVLFFVSVGMLLNPSILWTDPLRVLTVLAVIVVGKTLASAVLVTVLGHPFRTALTVSASLAQIGEFSFILAGLGLSLGLLPPEGRDLILAGAILSIALNPLAFRLSDWMGRRHAEEPPPLAERAPEAAPKPLIVEQQVVLVGYGRVGRIVVRDLAKAGIPFTVVEQNRDVVERLRKRGIEVVAGDASIADLLAQAPLDRTRLVVLAIPNINEARRIFDLVKAANPRTDVLVRADNEEEAAYFRDNGALEVFIAENELGHAMSRLAARDSRMAA